MFENLEILGRVVADAQPKTTNNGTPYIDMRMVVNRRTSKDKEPEAIWYSVRSFSIPTSMAKYYTKGKPLIVQGTYEDKIYTTNDGRTGIDRSILATRIDFVDGERQQNSSTAESTQKASGEIRNPSTAPAPKKAKANAKPEPAPQASVVADVDEDDLPF